MMKMSRGIACCCVALFFLFTSVSAVRQRLSSIKDLKKVKFGHAVPKHSLLLLHWFANEIDIDNNGVTRLTFDPDDGDYGAHHYGNYEGLLDLLPQGYRYFTIGNLNQDTSMPLPSYVLSPRREYVGGNLDRIIIRVMEQNTGRRGRRRIDRVYITQHHEYQGTSGYDPAHTYQITTSLLREIREFSVGQNHQITYLINRFESSADEFNITRTWGDLACLGLFLFIVLEVKSSHQNNRPGNNSRPGNNDRSRNNNRPGHNNRLENYNNRRGNRLEIGLENGLENGLEYARPENTCNPCRCVARAVCFLVLLIITAVIIFLFIVFAKKKG